MLKKLSLGALVFVAFASAGIGMATIISHENSSEKIESTRIDSENDDLGEVNLKTGINSSTELIQGTAAVSSSAKDDDEDEIKQSSRHNEDDDEDEEENDDDSSRTTNSVSQNQTTTQTVTQAVTTPTFTMTQVAAHKSSASCYTVISGEVYDLTSWISQHPGGSSAILSICGVDGTAAFNGQHGGQSRPASELAGFKIGVLSN
jgi:cytochrome b involved in lipid metabolism